MHAALELICVFIVLKLMKASIKACSVQINNSPSALVELLSTRGLETHLSLSDLSLLLKRIFKCGCGFNQYSTSHWILI